MAGVPKLAFSPPSGFMCLVLRCLESKLVREVTNVGSAEFALVGASHLGFFKLKPQAGFLVESLTYCIIAGQGYGYSETILASACVGALIV